MSFFDFTSCSSVHSFCSTTLVPLLLLSSLDTFPCQHLCHQFLPLPRSQAFLGPSSPSSATCLLSERPFWTTLCMIASLLHVTSPFIFLYRTYHYLTKPYIKDIYIYIYIYIYICICVCMYAYTWTCCVIASFPHLSKDFVPCYVFRVWKRPGEPDT